MRKSGAATAELDSADFRQVNLEGLDLSGCSFRGADFSGARLVRTIMQSVYASAANFSQWRKDSESFDIAMEKVLRALRIDG